MDTCPACSDPKENRKRKHKDDEVIAEKVPKLDNSFYLPFTSSTSAFKSDSISLNSLKIFAYEVKNPNFNYFTNDFLYNITEDLSETTLIIFNTHSNALCFKTINAELDSFSSLIEIPNKRIFCLGNRKTNFGIACIIDPELNIKLIQKPKINRYHSGLAFYDNFVYSFGGNNGHDASAIAAEKYDLMQNRWFQLTPLPKDIYSCSCISYKSSILISGYSTDKVYKFDIDVESYSEIPIELDADKFKILIYGKWRFYIIEEIYGFIYESEEQNEYKISKIGESTISGINLQFSPIYNQGNVFFSMCQLNMYYYYKFDLQKKKLEQIELNDLLLSSGQN